MTTLRPEFDRCGVCGTESEQMVVASSSIFGGPDLDLRPAQMERSNLTFYVRRCPECGACAPQLSALVSDVRRVIEGERYRQHIDDPSRPSLANSFTCWAMLAESLGRIPDAAQATLYAAWACDDAGLDASPFRMRALELFQTAWTPDDLVGTNPATHFAVLTDIARRAGDLDTAAQLCDEGLASSPEPLVRTVLKFQRSLIRKGDRGVHTVEEAEQSLGPDLADRPAPSRSAPAPPGPAPAPPGPAPAPPGPAPAPPPPAPAPSSRRYMRPEYGGPRLGFGAPRELGAPDRFMYGALEDAKGRGNRVAEAQAHVDLASALRQGRSLQAALEHADAALAVSRALQSDIDIAGCLSITGALKYDAGNYEGALRDHGEARDLLQRAGMHEPAAWCDLSAGVCSSVLGDYDGALRSFDRARQYFAEAGHVQAAEHVDGLIAQGNRNMDQAFLGITSPEAVTSCALCDRQIFLNQTYTRCMIAGCSIYGESLCMLCGSRHAQTHGLAPG